MNTPELLKRESRELFGLISSEFTGVLNPVINKSEFTVDIPPYSPCWGTLPELDVRQPWTVKTGFIPLLEKPTFCP